MGDSEQFFCTSSAEVIRSVNVERILLVDDDSTILHLEEKKLLWLGYSVNTCASSIEALEVFGKKFQEFDLVITDLFMPDMTGEILSQELIKIKPDIRILIYTGSRISLSDAVVKKNGIRGIIDKPIQIKELAGTIRQTLDE